MLEDPRDPIYMAQISADFVISEADAHRLYILLHQLNRGIIGAGRFPKGIRVFAVAKDTSDPAWYLMPDPDLMLASKADIDPGAREIELE